MFRKLTLAIATALSLGACSSMTGPNLFEYNADGESEPSLVDGSSIQTEQPGSAVIQSAEDEATDETA